MPIHKIKVQRWKENENLHGTGSSKVFEKLVDHQVAIITTSPNIPQVESPKPEINVDVNNDAHHMSYPQ